VIAVFLEHHEGQLQKGALGVLGKAASLGPAPVERPYPGYSTAPKESPRLTSARPMATVDASCWALPWNHATPGCPSTTWTIAGTVPPS